MRAVNLAEIVAQRNGLADVPVWDAGGKAVQLRVVWGSGVSAAAEGVRAESRHERGADVGNAQRRAPVLVIGGNEHIVAGPEKTDADLIECGWAEKIRCANGG